MFAGCARRGMSIAAFGLFILAACSSREPDLVVYLKTDLVAGVEFSSVDVELLSVGAGDEAAASIALRTLTATRQMRFVPDRRVASFTLAANQSVRVRVRLRDAGGVIVAERPTLLQFAGDFGLRVIVTRNCAHVSCPNAGGAAINAACLNGQCVDDRCQPSAPEFCPAVACVADGPPPSACVTIASCANASCDDGVCLYAEPPESLCPADKWCDPFRGCVPGPFSMDLDGGTDADAMFAMDGMLEPFDGAMDDGASSDALMSIDGDADATVDAGLACTAPTEQCGDACVNTETNIHHCGSCGNDCALLPNVDGAAVTCELGVCQLSAACIAPFAHCTSVVSDGCETDESSPTSCGGCATTCTSESPLCTRDDLGHYACASGCSRSTPTLCSMTCVDLDTNANSCGSCTNVCPSPDHGHATCVARSCGVVCDPDYHLCGSTCVSDFAPTSCGGRCTACDGVTNGRATCDGENCSFACDSGFHACGALCVDNNSVASCGSSCTSCPGAPAFGMATCDGYACGFVCLAGYHKCGGVCVPDDSTSACGAACLACSAPPTNGTAACVDGACTASCDAGYHACGGACVADTDPTHCGASCMACPMPSGGGALCLGGTCAMSCGSGLHLCGGACVSVNAVATCGSSCTPCTAPANGYATCDGSSCGFTCNPGYHACGGSCVSNTALSSCGASCSACTVPANASGTCNGTSCGYTCNSGYHACGANCVDNTSIMSCGASCATCPGAPMYGMATCDGTSCGFACLPGYHKCGSSCVRDDSTSQCGASCLACSAPPANGTAACVSGTCTSTCNAGYNACFGACVTTADTTHCGASCAVCSIPSNGSATCDGTSCGFTCNLGYHACGSGCASNTALTTCGNTCGEAPCSAPTNGTATCNGTSCGFTCNAGFVSTGSACDVAPPRPIRPISSSVMTTQTPRFAWQLASGTTGAVIDVCLDRACSSIVQSTTVSGSQYTASPALAAGLYFWRLRGRIGGATGTTTSPIWQITVPALSTAIDSPYGVALRDVDGDGYSDIALGSWVNNGERVFVFRGHAAGPSATADYILSAGISAPAYGHWLTMTDVNRDGFADVIVSDMSNNRAFVHLGSALGPSLLPSSMITAPASAAGAGGGAFGGGMYPAGDVNGDGYGDVIISSYYNGYIYHGSATGLAATPTTTLTGMVWIYGNIYTGISAGDFNGDGYTDVSTTASNGASNGNIFYGSASGLSAFSAATFGASGGRTLAADVNMDGYSDLVRSDGANIYVSTGNATGVRVVLSNTPAADVDAPSSIGMGWAVPGDLNGDGYPDLVVGASSAPAAGGYGVGRVYVYLGSSLGFGNTPGIVLHNPSMTSTNFGFTVGLLGDVDGDGRADVQVGTYGNDSYTFFGIPGSVGVNSAPDVWLHAPSGFSSIAWGGQTATQ